MPEETLKKLKKYVTDRIACLKTKLPEPVQGEPALYDEGHIWGELCAFEEILHEIEHRERFLRWSAEIDFIAYECSYEFISANLLSGGKDERRDRLQQYIKAELQGYFHMSLLFKWRRARRAAAEYMHGFQQGGAA